MAHPLRFVRAMRLVRGADFARAFEHGARARGSILLVVGFANGSERTRLGLSVGRSVWRSAVKRNRVRRIFRRLGTEGNDGIIKYGYKFSPIR